MNRAAPFLPLSRDGEPGACVPGVPPRPAASIWLERRLRSVDRLFNRIYGSRWNPLYQSGNLAMTFLLVTLVTGLYLFIFYKVADPYGSVAAIDGTWFGALVRSLHRYAADLAVVAVAAHGLKMLVGGRTWGRRAAAWVSGVLLLGVLFFCGWTGLVMAWDVQGQLVALEGARLMDLVPIFSEPLSRSFTHDAAVPGSFFFMNLFLHVALPLGLAGFLGFHATRVARPRLRPPREIQLYALGLLVAGAVLAPVPLPPRADLLAVPAVVPVDVFYAFWLPVARHVPALGHLLLWGVAFFGLVSLPWWWRPRQRAVVASKVDEERCTGCTTCYQDCPYDAIDMVPRRVPSRLSARVARVDPELCVGCGICAGSCAPMGVGPPGATGRDQLRRAEEMLAASAPGARDVVLVGCSYGPRISLMVDAMEHVVPWVSGCSGSVHTSVIELLLRRGAGGVFVLTCPGRDCLYREGPHWLAERVYRDREAELRERVDKRRVRLASFAVSELERVRRAVADFQREIRALAPAPAETAVDIDLECEEPDEAVV